MMLTATAAAFAAVGLGKAADAHLATVIATHVHHSLAGNTTACGGTWTNTAMEVASRSHRCGTRLRLRNPTNGAVITVTVTDHSPNSALDLSRNAFSHLAPLSQGTVRVTVQTL